MDCNDYEIGGWIFDDHGRLLGAAKNRFTLCLSNVLFLPVLNVCLHVS
jgi:hypothetical protein